VRKNKGRNYVYRKYINNMEQSFSENYKLINKIGSGSFGDVYLVTDINKEKGKIYACKVEEKKKSQRLREEYDIYKKLRGKGIKYGIPKVYSFIETQTFNIMVMELLGKSLDQIYNEQHFDIGTCLKLGYEIVQLLEKVHDAGFIHRDIKPSNFLIGYNGKSDRIYMLDFGLSKQYIEKNKHIGIATEKSLVGTARYASINVHMGIEASRRDDLESVGYMLLYFLKGKLPWQGLKHSKNVNLITLIGEVKMYTNFEDFCEGIPKCFYDYVMYCRKLRFQEKPNYKYLKNLFLDESKELNCEMKYIWT
jgi:serine/threonine protein kinase